MRSLLVIEDGNEYVEFARALLSNDFQVWQAQSFMQALQILTDQRIDALLIDLRFDRTLPESLIGNVSDTATRLFAGDTQRAVRYIQDQQGILILAELRRHAYHQPAVFVHDFPERRIQNLRKLYGDVSAVPSFDVATLLSALSKRVS